MHLCEGPALGPAKLRLSFTPCFLCKLDGRTDLRAGRPCAFTSAALRFAALGSGVHAGAHPAHFSPFGGERISSSAPGGCYSERLSRGALSSAAAGPGKSLQPAANCALRPRLCFRCWHGARFLSCLISPEK